MMTDVVIRAEALGKKYLIGHHSAESERYTTMRDAISQAVKGVLRSAGDIARGRQLISGDEVEEFWALQNVSFEIKRGEVVGMIGRNGAGKSTLLKILSRITEPSAGRVEIRGRVASLLEVGTGFHPELSGRENIYLNGAILGMARAEIARKFDEIVDFAGVEKFLDTPVKRFSSGMYVRLAFAVAAHLEPEVLIVDEVLAVGDVAFQKKCLGKMQDVAGQGRTVLFVSHNMAAVQSLCARGLVLRDGSLAMSGPVVEAIADYLSTGALGLSGSSDLSNIQRRGRGDLQIKNVEIFDGNGLQISRPITGKPCCFVLRMEGLFKGRGTVRAGLTFKDAFERPLFICANEATNTEPLHVENGSSILCSIPRFPLSEGEYRVSLFVEVDGTIQDWIDDGLTLGVDAGSFYGTPKNLPPGWSGKTVLVDNRWNAFRSSDTVIDRND